MDREPGSVLDIVWEIATTKTGQLLEQLEPLLPKPPEAAP
jgi:hypothetical protein